MLEIQAELTIKKAALGGKGVGMTEVRSGYDAFDFTRGMADCREGIPHESGKGESYDAGYSAEYQLEEINTANNKGN